jgi:hypothetical protein
MTLFYNSWGWSRSQAFFLDSIKSIIFAPLEASIRHWLKGFYQHPSRQGKSFWSGPGRYLGSLYEIKLPVGAAAVGRP